MRKIRFGTFVLWMLSCSVTTAAAQVSIGIGLPNVSIGINLPLFPELVPVPGYPVYYAPRVDANYFFYDGMYWVYQGDNWYASSWYNGPWWLVDPQVVPLFVLRIPVSYYRQPPSYFRGWRTNSPPRWGEHWGRGWEQRHSGWDRWQRGSVPAPAPLPVYQRQYSGDRYPRVEQQQTLRSKHYRYQPRDKIVRQHFQQQETQKTPAPAQRGRQETPPLRTQKQQEIQRSTPLQQSTPAGPRSQPPHQTPPQQRGPAIQDKREQPAAAQREQQTPHRGGENIQKSAPVKNPPQQRGQAVKEQKQQRAPAVHEHERRALPRGAAPAPRARPPRRRAGNRCR